MSESASNATAPRRLMSVDALRGFDMFWIIGAEGIVRALDKMGGGAVTQFVSTQLKHCEWEGFRFYDLIFPLFLFIVGVSIVFSLDKVLTEGGRAAVLWRVLRRSVLLYMLGVIYYGGLSQPWPEVQLGGVLHRIAACYLFAALIYAFVRSVKGLAVVSVLLLMGYWALVTFVPFPDLKLDKPVVAEIAARIGSDSPSAIAAAVPERVSGVYEQGRNLTNYLDFRFLPGKKAQFYYINEGLLSTIPAIALSLFGAMAGLLLKRQETTSERKIACLLVAGAAVVALGWLWSFQFPIIKRIWTSSFVLVAGGFSAMLMALFYWLVDVRQLQRWCQPFVWIGCNALVLYLAFRFVKFQELAAHLAGGDIRRFMDEQVTQGFGALLIAIIALLLALLLARFLYKRQIFIRV